MIVESEELSFVKFDTEEDMIFNCYERQGVLNIEVIKEDLDENPVVIQLNNSGKLAMMGILNMFPPVK
jgi:hypothetical protein